MVKRVGGSTSSRLGWSESWPMLVRRIATVTICAPLATTAARVSAKSLYLPVPTSRRDEYVFPPMINGSRFSLGFILSSADSDDDFKPVAVRQPRLGMTAARHNFAVALDRDALSGKRHRINQLHNIGASPETLFPAVNG